MRYADSTITAQIHQSNLKDALLLVYYFTTEGSKTVKNREESANDIFINTQSSLRLALWGAC